MSTPHELFLLLEKWKQLTSTAGAAPDSRPGRAELTYRFHGPQVNLCRTIDLSDALADRLAASLIRDISRAHADRLGSALRTVTSKLFEETKDPFGDFEVGHNRSVPVICVYDIADRDACDATGNGLHTSELYEPIAAGLAAHLRRALRNRGLEPAEDYCYCGYCDSGPLDGWCRLAVQLSHSYIRELVLPVSDARIGVGLVLPGHYEHPPQWLLTDVTAQRLTSLLTDN